MVAHFHFRGPAAAPDFAADFGAFHASSGVAVFIGCGIRADAAPDLSRHRPYRFVRFHSSNASGAAGAGFFFFF
ncbi:hypothetical protein [uncultured Ottowia sp.]|uniref:hypothetical protein n=1 Tax=uncultured Ottowia sp. TaxID=543067 RepID=UPI002592266C|nr:hypothetical protein [uncultured Ottowia sp.]